LLVCALFAAMPAAAQEQRATVEGTVKDAQGGVLPGVTVQATNTNVGTTVDTVTDANGVYRFPALAPGYYVIAAQLTGFQSSKVENLQLLLGQIKTVTFTLQLAGVQETVMVTGDAPLVDTKQSARSTSIRQEQIENLPKGRDFSTLVTQSAGANAEQGKLGGLSIDGASAGENRYIVDGAETTNLQNGTSGKQVLSDFIEEVQVKSSGYTAEYGGATGGVINVVTKSGTNNWRGSGLMYYESDALRGDTNYATDNPRTLRLGLTNANIAEEVTYDGDGYSRVEPGLSLGGPIVRDRTWFFVAYNPTFVEYERTVKLTANKQDVTTKREEPRHYLTANSTTQLGSSLRTRVAYNNSWNKFDGRLASLTGTDAPGTNYDNGANYPNWSLSGSADWVVTPSFYVGGRVGYYFSDTNSFGVPTIDRYLFAAGNNLGMPGIPPSQQFATGYQNIPTNSSTTFDKQKRLAFQVDGTWYGNFGGQHTIKGGVQIDKLGNEVLSGEQGNLIRFYWDRNLGGVRGLYGYYRVRSNGVLPQQGFITEGDVSTNNYGLFIQDAWTINNKLTINLGLRTENEKVPAYAAGPDIPSYGVEFSFADKLAPRVGFAYDIKGDGKWKAYGSWGIFYDIFKMELPRGSFGGDKWWEYYYTLDTPSWNTVGDAPNCPPACPGTLIQGPIDFRHPSFGSDAIDPDLKPMQMQEASFGFEHQLSPVVAVSARYIRKWLIRAIEDTGSLDAAGNEIYIIANPGENLTALAWTNPNVNQPKAKRDYDGVEFAVTKNLSSNYFLRASYLWSRLYGNYSGLSQSDENGRTSPNVGRAFDYPLMSFDENAEPVYGLLATDRPHQFKASFFYQTNFGMSLGLNGYFASGIPRTRETLAVAGHGYQMQYLGRASDGRLDMYSQTDFLIQQEFKLGDARRIQLSLNVLNVFNEENPINFFATEPAQGLTVDFSEQAFYEKRTPPIQTLMQQQKVTVDPRFLQDTTWQTPIAARFGVKFIF
jgi:hypothetical protein